MYVDENTGAVEMDINNQNPTKYICRHLVSWAQGLGLIESGKHPPFTKAPMVVIPGSPLVTHGSGFATGDKLGRSAWQYSRKIQTLFMRDW